MSAGHAQVAEAMDSSWESGRQPPRRRLVLVAVLAAAGVASGLLVRGPAPMTGTIGVVADDRAAPVVQPAPSRPAAVTGCAPRVVAAAPASRWLAEALTPDADGSRPCFVVLRDLAAGPPALGTAMAPDGAVGTGIVARPELRAVCEAAAGAAGHAVACPGSLPAGGRAVLCAATCTIAGGVRLSLDRFAVPEGGCTGCIAEIVLASAPVRSAAAELLTTCRGGRAEDEPGHWVCPPRLTSSAQRTSYVMRRARTSGVVYAVKVHVEGADQRAILAEIFSNVELVAAPRDRSHRFVPRERPLP